MSDRCILCGAGDDSIDHQDYNDWVSACLSLLSTGKVYPYTIG